MTHASAIVNLIPQMVASVVKSCLLSLKTLIKSVAFDLDQRMQTLLVIAGTVGERKRHHCD
jgi:hypothetical protein